jgi:tRNA-binding EMAP/Myf-like protein
MSVIAMTCVKKYAHPNADKLSVYSFRNNLVEYTIVANNDNTYEVGDVAAVAISGLLKSGIKIKPVTIREVLSEGMALKKVSVSEGTDLSNEYMQSELYIKKWPEISLFYIIVNYVKSLGKPISLNYRAKIKLDGSNVGIQVLDGNLFIQSRESELTPESDWNGFAKWILSEKDYWTSLQKDIIIYGEFCGEGIQKRTSITKIGKKIFCIFSIVIGNKMIIEPDEIAKILGNLPENVYILPWLGDTYSVDYLNQDALLEFSDKLNKVVEEVENCDPWVKDTFGIEGLGEGIILYPYTGPIIDVELFSNFAFKAKGEKHKVVNVKKPVQIDPEKANSIKEFVNLFVTENRLEQFLNKLDLDIENLGEFIKIVSCDIQKESIVDLERSGLIWKDVVKHLNVPIRDWYINKLKANAFGK